MCVCAQYYGTGESFVFNLSQQTRPVSPATTPTRSTTSSRSCSTTPTNGAAAGLISQQQQQKQHQQHSSTLPVLSPKAKGCTTADQRRSFASLHKYMWSGLNPYFQFSSETTLGLGGGGAGFSLFVGEDFACGTSC